MFGSSRERMVGQSIETLVPQRFRDRHMAHRAHYMKDAKTRAMGANLQLFAQRADGSEFPVDIMLSPMEIDQRRLALAMVRDITERKRAEARVQWLMRGVNHRARNILSVVQAMAHQSRTGLSQEFVSEFEERIQGLSASYDLLANNKWQNVPLAELVRVQLAHFGYPVDGYIAVRGPDFWITSAAAQTIGMALHELATNAGKYGAFSAPRGLLQVSWTVADDRLTVTWDETEGPTVDKVSEPGFGTKLLKSALSAFDGRTEISYLKTGLHCIMQCRIPRSE